MTKVLFILKRKEDYNITRDSRHDGLSTGLYNSVKFIDNMLRDLGIDSVMEVAVDNNCIDRLVTKHRPTHVIIEALWVVPEKYEILQSLHPNVKWILRLHSELPFIAGEGPAMDWIGEYSKIRNMWIAVNSPRMRRDIETYLDIIHGQYEKEVLYLPNFYPQDFVSKKIDKNKDHIDIGCFGAVRPLKNHLVQAIAALKFASTIRKKLNFHLNLDRVEMNGNPVVRNLTSLFGQVNEHGHTLVNHTWAPRSEFLKTCAQMDMGMQCSFSETFNIVGADLISQGVPLVGSPEIPWMNIGLANPTNTQLIYYSLLWAYTFPKFNVWMNQRGLKKYTNRTKDFWLKIFG